MTPLIPRAAGLRVVSCSLLDMPNERTVDSWRFAGSMLAKMLDVALPVDRLRELVSEGHVGAIADSHYSIMGFQGSDSSRLVEESAPAIADATKSEEVDLALLAPV